MKIGLGRTHRVSATVSTTFPSSFCCVWWRTFRFSLASYVQHWPCSLSLPTFAKSIQWHYLYFGYQNSLWIPQRKSRFWVGEWEILGSQFFSSFTAYPYFNNTHKRNNMYVVFTSYSWQLISYPSGMQTWYVVRVFLGRAFGHGSYAAEWELATS